jgi:hypothetical protein
VAVSLFLPRLEPSVFRLHQRVKRTLVEHAGFPEWRGRERIDHGIMEFNTVFVVPDHAPLDQFAIAKDVKEPLQPDAEVLKFTFFRKFLSHREHRALPRCMRQLNSDRGGSRFTRTCVGAIGGKRRLIDAQRQMKALRINRSYSVFGR